MNDDEFFSATPELQTIQRWAHSRFAAVWAVFGAVLLRVSATTEPTVQLPGIIGGRASLNLLAAFVSPSGGGKGISDKVARLAWPAPIVERPIGSGEGIAATFVPPKKEGVEPITRAIISVPEIDTLAGLASRQGSILLAQLKSMAMGEQLGQANASDATTRIIAPHAYRACMGVGAQPAHTGVLFNDTSGGTPQRFLWFMTIDPDMPGDIIDDPEPLDTRLPFWTPGDDGVIEIGYGPTEIAETVRSAHLARQRGDSDALDGHAMLTRCKVAGTLAILHHRSVVSDLDWELSGAVMAQSNRTRDWLVAESTRVARQKVRERALARAAGEEVIVDRKLERAKKSVVRWLERHEELAAHEIRKKVKADLREHLDSALAELVDTRQILEVPVERGTRYRLIPEVHGVPEVHGSYPQVSDGVPEVHRVPSAPTIMTPPVTGDSLVTPENPSSGPVTPEVTGDPTPPLHAVDSAPKPTCAQWVRNHVLSLLADDVDTIESRELFDAGEAAGYRIDNLRRAVMDSDLIATVGRTGHGATYRLGAGSTSTVVPCPQWLDEWLREHGDWVKAADAFAAGDAAGYSRMTVKSAAKRIGVLKRGASIATEWKYNPDHEEVSA